MDIKTLRSWRISGIALFDVIASIIGMIIIADYLNITKTTAALSAIPIGIVVHYVFNTNTTLNYKLGLSDKPAE